MVHAEAWIEPDVKAIDGHAVGHPGARFRLRTLLATVATNGGLFGVLTAPAKALSATPRQSGETANSNWSEL